MTREIIEDFRFIVIPYMVNRLKEINYEGQGGSDAEEFMSDFNEICDLAIKALELELKWIPVSERLPEDSGEHLVSVTDKEDDEYKQVGVAWFAHPKDYDIKDGEWRELMIDEVVTAWMPLPTPFELQESEDIDGK